MTSVNTPALPARAERMSQHRRRQMSDRAISQLFIWPTLILLILMNIFPLFYSLYLSFNDYSVIANEPAEWVALENYQEILANQQVREIYLGEHFRM